jgi:hypothetical protein
MNVVRGGPEHEAAIQRTLKAAKAAGKKAAIFCKLNHGNIFSLYIRVSRSPDIDIHA